MPIIIREMIPFDDSADVCIILGVEQPNIRIILQIIHWRVARRITWLVED